MAVHTQLAALKILRVIFEARYDEGYRYMDRCGQTIVRIKKHSPYWITGPIDPQRGVITNRELQLTLNMGNESMLVATIDELEPIAMGAKVEVLSREADALY